LGGAGGSAGGKVNINTADSTALMTLSGIGEARAAAIIQYREEHGKFSSIEEIMQVPGIKEAAFQKIKQNIEI
jgi:competence protein ComEA